MKLFVDCRPLQLCKIYQQKVVENVILIQFSAITEAATVCYRNDNCRSS